MQLQRFDHLPNVLGVGHRCDEHQLCLVMTASTKLSDCISNLYRLGRAISYWPVWDKLTKRVLELVQPTIILARPDPEVRAINAKKLTSTVLRYAFLNDHFSWDEVDANSDPLLVHCKRVLELSNGSFVRTLAFIVHSSLMSAQQCIV